MSHDEKKKTSHRCYCIYIYIEFFVLGSYQRGHSVLATQRPHSFQLFIVAESGSMMADKSESRYERLPPPAWDPDTKSYDDWRFKINIWQKACTRAKLNQRV